MRRLVRNIQGERRPLIVHRRLYRLRVLDLWLRHGVCRMTGMKFRVPRYRAPSRTPEQEARTLLAIEAYVGMRSPDPRVARYFNERRRWLQITRTSTTDETKRVLVAEGPRCEPEDEEHVLSMMDPARRYMAKPEGRSALARVKDAADETIARLSAASSPQTSCGHRN